MFCSPSDPRRSPRELFSSSSRLQQSRSSPRGESPLAFGPEGGWIDQEFEAASGAGFQEASLGRNILRSETAVVAGLAAVHLYFDPDAEQEGQAPAPPLS